MPGDAARRQLPQGLDLILENFTREVLRSQPDDIIAFGVRYFTGLKNGEDMYGGPKKSSVGAAPVKAAVASAPAEHGHHNKSDVNVIELDSHASGTQTEESTQEPNVHEPGDEIHLQPVASPNPGRRGRRQSVSAESMQPDSDYEKVVIPKSEEKMERIREIITKNFLFSGLDREQSQDVVNAMFEKTVAAGEVVIQQGDDGDYFYVVDEGTFDIYVNKVGVDPPGEHVGGYKAGGGFGELALMYNTPRAATIVCTSPALLWAMDRVTFRRILMDTTARKRRMYESFLESVPLLEQLEAYERVKIADALETLTFQDGQTIVRQGDVGDRFYLVEYGEAICTVHDDADPNEEKQITTYKKGDYFGELALITKKPRAATVRAVGEVICASLDVDAFVRLLGPCADVMKRNIERYAEQLKELNIGRTPSPSQ
eukprot:Opistho-2@60225